MCFEKVFPDFPDSGDRVFESVMNRHLDFPTDMRHAGGR